MLRKRKLQNEGCQRAIISMGKELILDKKSFRKKVQKLSNLPTLPNLLDKFTEMIEDPNTPMEAFGKELSKDQVITGKLLKLVNSAFYGFPGRISTVTHAMVLLGHEALKGLIITSNIFENLPPEAYPLWRHSMGVSLACRAIANELDLPDVEEFAVAGLLHDIGKVVLHIEAPEEYKQVIFHALETEQIMWQAERKILGFDHAAIGRWLCEEWKLPEKLIIPIAYHHLPAIPKEHDVRVAVIAVADIMVRGMGAGAEDDFSLDVPDPVLEKKVPLTLDQIRKLVEEIDPEIESLKNLDPEDIK